MKNKVVATLSEAVADIHDGATVMFGGFSRGQGIPYNLIDTLIARKLRKLTIIANNLYSTEEAVRAGIAGKLITCYMGRGSYDPRHAAVEEAYTRGELEVEMVGQGILPLRIQAWGAGIAGFYTRVGAGTLLEKGKQKATFDGEEYILERALGAEFALLKAHKSDTFGNLVYRKGARNINPTMAMGAETVIVEVDEIVPLGALDPDLIVTPGIFVDRVVQAKAKKIEFENEVKGQSNL